MSMMKRGNGEINIRKYLVMRVGMDTAIMLPDLMEMLSCLTSDSLINPCTLHT